MRKTDINKYVGAPGTANGSGWRGDAAATAVSLCHIVLKTFLALLAILLIAGSIVLFSLVSFIMGLRDESIKLDLSKLKLNYTSFIYVNDENGNPLEYQRLYSSENRIWVDYAKIPENMKNAVIAIEDKRFKEHDGVDWYRTFGAVTTLFTKGSSYGGSTITQQLVKNITGETDVSLTRKAKEIFRALNLDKKYSKEEILEAYLNIVGFGSGCQGVQAAANLYFDKDISECDLAECASIAAITQNPYKYTPLIFPENNKERQQLVLAEMLDQGLISQNEYDTAMKKSEHMVFVGKNDENVVDDVPIWDWYTDAMFEDVITDLQSSLSISKEKATYMMYHGGLKIYSAMDQNAQNIAESVINGEKNMPSDQKIQMGYLMMDYSGRVLATVGRRGEKTGNRLLSYATDSQRQPGSSIKPIAVYGPAVEMGKINYSSILPDEPIDNYFGPGKPGPNNWYRNPPYYGTITVQRALEISANAPAVQLCRMISPTTSFAFLTEKLHFTHLNPKTDSVQLAAMALGGMNGGVTVREMTAGFQIFGNGGKFTDPYTYYYVEDHDGNVILDNRNKVAAQVISPVTATIMHKLLRNVVYGPEGTGGGASVSGWDVFGKTGTTDDDKDSWFVGGSPYAVAGIWTGYETPKTLSKSNTGWATKIWKNIMTQYLEDKEKIKFTYDSSVISATYCTETGKLASALCPSTKTGWYAKGSLPPLCDSIHASSSSPSSFEGASSSSEASSGPGENSGESSQGGGSSAASSQQDNSSAPDPDESSSSSSSPPYDGFPDWPPFIDEGDMLVPPASHEAAGR